LAAKQAECQQLQADGANQRQQSAAVVLEKEALEREQGRLQMQLADTKKQVGFCVLRDGDQISCKLACMTKGKCLVREKGGGLTYHGKQ